MLKAPGLGFPRFLKKIEFCVTNFSLEFSNPRSPESLSTITKKFTYKVTYISMA